MKNSRMAAHGLAAAICVGLAMLQPTQTIAGEREITADKGMPQQADGNRHRDRRVKYIRGVTVTGTNSVRGRPFFDWGGTYGTFNFPTTFIYNENGAQPLLIDEATPDSAVLATGVSPEYLLIRGDSPDVVKPESINVPLRKVPVNIDFDPSLAKKRPLRGLLEADPLELSQAEPAADITLGQWMKASGVAAIECSGDGANIRLRMKNLIPNRIYSVWATMALAEPASGNVSSTLPVGGTPSIFMTDPSGDATYQRHIKFCPLDTQSGLSPMLDIELLYHANHSTYGAIPAPGLMLGLLTFPHIVFPVNVALLDN
jgi:hypothetical protein